MTLSEAIKSGKPFRRPCWIYPDDKYQWVGISDDRLWEGLLNWYDDDGKDTGHSFGDINFDMAISTDYEIKEI